MGNLEDLSKWAQLEAQVLGSSESLASLDAQFLVLIDDTYSDLFTGQRTGPERVDKSAWKKLIETVHKLPISMDV